MTEYEISKSIRWNGKITDRVGAVCRMFGLTAQQLGEHGLKYNCRLKIKAGDIVYITGPSGAGKSVLLKELQKRIVPAKRVNLDQIPLPADKTVIDLMPANLEILGALKLLTTAGLSDVYCILNQPANLSEGEKYRYRLAMAIGAGKEFVFADEFCSGLDRITASVIAYNINKFAKETGVTFVLAASTDDILADLLPQVLVYMELSGKPEVIYRNWE